MKLFWILGVVQEQDPNIWQKNFILNVESYDIIYIFYALHEVPKKLRNGIVIEFFRILKNNGKLFIKEPQRENDGMPINEIQELMISNGFYRESCNVSKGTYSAVYIKSNK